MGSLIHKQEELVEEPEEEEPEDLRLYEEELKIDAEKGKLKFEGPYAFLTKKKHKNHNDKEQLLDDKSKQSSSLPNLVEDEEEEEFDTDIIFEEEDDVGVLTTSPGLFVARPSCEQERFRFKGKFMEVSYSPVGSEADLHEAAKPKSTKTGASNKKKDSIIVPTVFIHKEKMPPRNDSSNTFDDFEQKDDDWLIDGRINKQMGSPR